MCSIPVDFTIFGDTCDGKKKLGVQVKCNGTAPPPSTPTPAPTPPQSPVYRHSVVVPVGVAASVVVPLRGHDAGAVTITESGHLLWAHGQFVPGVVGIASGAVNEAHGGVGFELSQGSYLLELLAPL